MNEPTSPEWSIYFHDGARLLTLGEFGQRLSAWLKELGDWEPTLSRWYHQAYSLKAALARPVDTSPEALTAYLTREFERDRRRYRDQNSASFFTWAPIPELGKDGTAGTNVSRRLFPGQIPNFPPNVCVVDIPAEGEIGRRVYQTSNLIKLFTMAARRWEPDYGVVEDYTYHHRFDQKHGIKKRVPGWIIYVSRAVGRVPPLPAPVRIIPVDDIGHIVVVTEEPFRTDNPEHVECAERVFELLDRAGLMDEPP